MGHISTSERQWEAGEGCNFNFLLFFIYLFFKLRDYESGEAIGPKSGN